MKFEEEILDKVRIMDLREDGVVFIEISPGGIFPYNGNLRKIYGGTYFRNKKGKWYSLSIKWASVKKFLYQQLLTELVEAKEESCTSLA